MSPQPLMLATKDRPRGLNVVGEQVTVLADATQTGSFEITLQSGPEGSGPPPHSHPWDEAFYVLSGELVFGVGGEEEQTATAGTLVNVPGGTTHWFRWVDGGEMLSLTSRAGAVDFFTEVDAKVPPELPDLPTLIGIAMAHGLSVPPPG